MVRHLVHALRVLFPSRPAQAEVLALVVVVAAVPIVEMLVIRLFSDLAIHGPDPRARG